VRGGVARERGGVARRGAGPGRVGRGRREPPLAAGGWRAPTADPLQPSGASEPSKLRVPGAWAAGPGMASEPR
jgi:hypothetical protein